MTSEFPSATTEQYLESRKKIVEDFKKSVLGNDWRDLEEQEIFFDPVYQYVCGVLYPRETRIHDVDLGTDLELEQEEDNDEHEESEEFEEKDSRRDSSLASGDENDEEDINVIDLSSNSRQSAFGLSFITEKNEILKVKYGFSTYEVLQKDKDSKESRKKWKQNKFLHEIEVEVLSDKNNQKFPLGENDKLVISVKSRERDNLVITTLAMSHKGEKKLDEECFFQVGLQVETKKGSFKRIKTPLLSLGDEEAESLGLLFRDKLSYATGKGCATDWDIQEGNCKKVWTDFVPTYEVKSIDPAEGDFSYQVLSDINEKFSLNERYEPIERLISGYEKWIGDQSDISSGLDQKNQEVAKKHIEKAERYLQRMKEGYKLITNDQNVEDSFRLTNLSMMIQFNRSKFLLSKEPNEELRTGEESILESLKNCSHEDLKGVWRPFQLAFLLATIPEMVYPEEYPEMREEIDLIWFPTGGGKTEAYLAVLALTIIYRRLMDPEDAGVTAIMRYTLRLLTSDQFRRSSALICALDFIRKEKILDKDLGTEPISLGLWMGGAATPLTHNDASIKMGQSYRDKNGLYKFILHECPWCKSKLTNPDHDGYSKTRGKVIVRCTDTECYFHKKIPVYLWQQAVFDEKPSLLLATVDNFAKLAWLEEASNLFQNAKFSPPDLIIQDELHLISGPLGSLVGIFESVLLKLLSSEDKVPKIIGASATLTFSDRQTRSLYRGRKSNIFPPQVLNWGESFFAKESVDKPGRLYMGYFGSSRGSMVESATSAVIPLLQAPQQYLPCLVKDAKEGDKHIFVKPLGSLKKGNSFTIYHSIKEKYEMEKYQVKNISKEKEEFYLELDKPIKHDISIIKGNTLYPQLTEKESSLDPYGTIVWYFNSKRELAYMSNQTQRINDLLRGDSKKIHLNELGPANAPSRFSRKITRIEELTGRLSQDEIEDIVEQLNKPWSQIRYDSSNWYFKGIDLLFSTNMISVGVDIQRLGLMAIYGQPRTTSEYIQASSRVGRQHPGLVVTFYNHTKSKDRSIYEMFKNYHQSFYRFVESVSVTPFSAGSRQKALPAIFIALLRAMGKTNPSLSNSDKEIISSAKNWILESVEITDPLELEATKEELDEIVNKWKKRQVEEWGKMGGKQKEVVRLMDPYGDMTSKLTVFSAPTSLRSADKEAQVKIYDGD